MDDWIKSIDEAAAWANNELMAQYGVYFMPTAKHKNKKDDGISLIKDLLIQDVMMISSACEPLLWEMENYITDDFGKFPKKNDHLLDCLRYLLASANYDINEAFEAKRWTTERGMISPKNDMLEMSLEKDWTQLYEFKG